LKALPDETKHYYTEADEYSKQIVEYASNLAELEKEKRAMEASQDQNILAQKMVATEESTSHWGQGAHRLAS